MKVRLECYISPRPGVHCRAVDSKTERVVINSTLLQVVKIVRQMNIEVVNNDDLIDWLINHVSFVSKPSDREIIHHENFISGR